MPKEDTQWKPGQTGNPHGRPKKEYSITETIRDMMAEKPEIKQALSSKVLEMALKGDTTALKLVWAYMDGMPTQPIENKIITPELDAETVTKIDELMKGNVKPEPTT